jgi:hypothetical protein
MPVPSQGHYGFHSFPLLTDFVCLYNYEFWLSLCKIVRSSVILLLPLFTNIRQSMLKFKTHSGFHDLFLNYDLHGLNEYYNRFKKKSGLSDILGGFMSYLCYLCWFAYSGVHVYCVVFFVLFVFVLCTLCCQFLWIVHFWLPLCYSLTFINSTLKNNHYVLYSTLYQYDSSYAI